MTADHITPELQELDRLIDTGEKDPNDPNWQGLVLLFMARRVRYMMERDTMTVAMCDIRRAGCPGANLFKKPRETIGLALVQQMPWLIVVGLLLSVLVWMKGIFG